VRKQNLHGDRRKGSVLMNDTIRAIELSTASDELKDHLITHLLRIRKHLIVMRTFSQWSNHAS